MSTKTLQLLDSMVKQMEFINILDNGDFTNPVNQRGFVSGDTIANGKYFIDRWRAYNGDVQPKMIGDGISFASGTIAQTLLKSNFIGKPITAVMWCADGVKVVKSGIVPESADWSNVINVSSDVNGAQIVVTNTNDKLLVRVISNGVVIKHVALYDGEYTLAAMPAYRTRGYVNELLECKRYFRVISGVNLVGLSTTSTATFSILLDVPMRIAPTVNIVNYGKIKVNGQEATPVDYRVVAQTVSGITIVVDHERLSNAANHTTCLTRDAKIELSADF